MILAGDVGGTKCDLALVEKQERIFSVRHQRRYRSREFSRFEEIVAAFLKEARPIVAASQARRVIAAGFGVAGPVIGGQARLTNLDWEVNADSLARQIGVHSVVLLNDLEATGYGLPWLEAGQMLVLNPGTPRPQAAQALIAAGTGLGEAILHWSGGRYVVAPGEGGHCDFAPRSEQEIELLRYMKKAGGPVSFEMLLSGRGFLTLHQFLDARVRHPDFDGSQADPAPGITRRALDGSCPVCAEALGLWTSLYGAEAGNLALKALSLGGMFVAGGIAPKILPKMTDGTFLRAFCQKSKFENLLSQIPVHLVLGDQAPLVGAAAEAARVPGA
jgi:glucokinase